MLFEPVGDGAKVLEPVEEALDKVAFGVGGFPRTIGLLSVRHRLDAGLDAPTLEISAKPITVIARIGDQGVARFHGGEHVVGALAVMGLAGRQLQRDWQTIGVDDGMDFRRQSAARAPHASGVNSVPNGGRRGFGAVLFFPFLPFAAC